MYKNKFSDGNAVRGDTLTALARIVHQKDYNAEEHSERMGKMAEQFAGHLGLPHGMRAELVAATMLHDIGKIGLPGELLTKEAGLTAEEWIEIKTHPEMGYRILRAIRELSYSAEEAVLTHHEHWNGAGYPKGLKREAIPFISRMITIIDTYDVMTHDRPFRDALTHGEAVEELKRCAGTQFDPLMVEKFLEFLETSQTT